MAFLDRSDCLTSNTDLQSERKPRICILTTRGFSLDVFRCGFYEGQDILLDIDDVDLIYLEPKKGYEFRKTLHEKIIWHDITKKMVTINMTLQPIKLTKEYDLLIAYLPHCEELIHIPAIRRLKDHCKTSICWINELWAKDVQDPKFNEAWLSGLEQFDHIAIGLDATAKAVSEVLKRPCAFVPTGIDALRFNPYPDPSARVIDIYSMGRAWQGLHESFLDIAAKKKIFYVYDTVNTGSTPVRDYRQHREMLANIAKRVRYFVVAPAKMNSTNETGGQIEIGARYFEAAAAGAILLGQSPDCESFHNMFNWPDSVIEIQPDGSDAADVLSSLATQPDRLMEMSRRNARESLLRHDWLYRWQEILTISGLKPTPRLELRENRLKVMALKISTAQYNDSIVSK
ncbi:conserved hypothetical protein [Crenothrix polyspora]|uniref:Spore protein YkvP/CgeB glycosyl transferase-like domain-containing protein n=1 Tax=Crenothrix polyspora TaxID=360316 RepID=A0A1R4H2N9_9GAMM|nr:glycosyltransferase [Crenothrix polyspora]SJM90446.1 conserved hypothetical protein [Crenothrix polyspora]